MYSEQVRAGLILACLTDAERSEMYFTLLVFCSMREGRPDYSDSMRELTALLASTRFYNLKWVVRRQIVWLTEKLSGKVADDDESLERIYLILLRQVIGGDMSLESIKFCTDIAAMLTTNFDWIRERKRLIQHVVYYLLRSLPDHKHIPGLLEMEMNVVVRLIRHDFEVCRGLGRDFVRLLLNVSKMQPFQILWRDMPTSHHDLLGIEFFYTRQTPREFFAYRLTPDMHHKLDFILNAVPRDLHFTYLERFRHRFALTDTESLYPDLIRFILNNIHPKPADLRRNVVHRWEVILSLLLGIKSPIVAQECKFAIYMDWLMYNPEVDHFMTLEPGALLIDRCAKQMPRITCTMLEYLWCAVENFHPKNIVKILHNIRLAMHTMVSKGVVVSLKPIYNQPKLDSQVRVILRKLFPMFITRDHGAPTLEELREGLLLPAQQKEMEQPKKQHVAPVAKEEGESELVQTLRKGFVTALRDSTNKLRILAHVAADFIRKFLVTNMNGSKVNSIAAGLLDIFRLEMSTLGNDEVNQEAEQFFEQVIQFFYQSRTLDQERLAELIVIMMELNPAVRAYILLMELRETRWKIGNLNKCFFGKTSGEEQVANVLKLVLDADADVFYSVIPAAFRCLSSWLTGDIDILTIVFSTADPQRILSLKMAIHLEGTIFFGNRIEEFLILSCEWPSVDQSLAKSSGQRIVPGRRSDEKNLRHRGRATKM